jgi:hypothetical protein
MKPPGKSAKTGAIRVWIAADAPEPTAFAANELACILSEALGIRIAVARDPAKAKHELSLGSQAGSPPSRSSPVGDGFVIEPREKEVVVSGASGAAIVHGVYRLLRQVGAGMSLDGRLFAPQLKGSFPWSLAAERFEPAFARRAFVSDIMTYHYEEPDLFASRLKEDRKFIAWMGWQGINRFFYIRHARDSRARIDELAPALRERGIGAEYGGHVLQLLLERERFTCTPELFPMGSNGRRNAQGNLCASNPAAIEVVCRNALSYVRDHPDNRLFHVWGADVREGAWCACAACARLSPQLQYMAVVNAVARGVAQANEAVEVAYLAYHDTIEADPRLKPDSNVCFEWAARERCYRHAIDDPRCSVNRFYWEALRRYVDLFHGNGHVFEYYADAVLFSGLGFGTPAVVERDLRAYRRAGVNGISCLTFGAYSILAYPINLIAFAANSLSPASKSWHAASEAAAERHAESALLMERAYRHIDRASKLVLSYGDVFRVDRIPQRLVPAKRKALLAAAANFDHAVQAAEQAEPTECAPLHRAEIWLWRYGAETLRALADYLQAFRDNGADRSSRAHRALGVLESAFSHIRAIAPQAKGVWGEIDLESLHKRWLAALRRRSDLET